MLGRLTTAGEDLSIDCDLPWVAELISEGSGGELRADDGAAAAVHIRVEADQRKFETGGCTLLTRGAWHNRGEVVLENACTAGFDLRLSCSPDRAEFTFRWRPPARDRVAARVLRSRFHLLARAVLIQYPALWWAGTRGRAPLHASAFATGTMTALLTAPSGVGRSTLILQEVEAGGRSVGDNLAVGDGTTVWGLVEPVRVDGGGGRRMPHGRSEARMLNRADALVPGAFVALERGSTDSPELVPSTGETCARSLITSTYMAGELRRYWSFAATLSAGTGIGPAHPPVARVAEAFAGSLPCFLLQLGNRPGVGVSELLEAVKVAA